MTAQADNTEGAAPLTVNFSAVASDPEGRRLRYAWDFDADGTIDSRQATPPTRSPRTASTGPRSR